MSGDYSWLPALLQTSDPLFPTGAYAHSLGLEEFTRMAGVQDESALKKFVEMHLLPALASQELPYLRFAFDVAHDLNALSEIDREISAWKLAKETRDASISIGRRRLAALRAMHPLPCYEDFAEAISRASSERCGESCEPYIMEKPHAHGHHLTVCALQAAGENFPLMAALDAWYYQSVAGACSAALKLIRIGQEGCQRVMRLALSQTETTVRKSLQVAREDAGHFSPVLEIASMRHEFSNERLFIS